METGWFGYGKKRFYISSKSFLTNANTSYKHEGSVWARVDNSTLQLSLACIHRTFFFVCEKWDRVSTFSNRTQIFIFSVQTKHDKWRGCGVERSDFFLWINFSQTYSGIFFLLPCLSSILNFNSIIFLSLFRDVWSRIIARNIFLFTFSAVFSRKIHSMIMQSSISLRSLSFLKSKRVGGQLWNRKDGALWIFEEEVGEIEIWWFCDEF